MRMLAVDHHLSFWLPFLNKILLVQSIPSPICYHDVPVSLDSLRTLWLSSQERPSDHTSIMLAWVTVNKWASCLAELKDHGTQRHNFTEGRDEKIPWVTVEAPESWCDIGMGPRILWVDFKLRRLFMFNCIYFWVRCAWVHKLHVNCKSIKVI